MSGIEHGKNIRPNLSGEDWKVEFDTPERMRFTLTAGTLRAVSTPASINGMAENTGLAEKPRIHLSEDELEASLEEETVIPFGAEPEISRGFKIQHKTMFVMTDLIMRASPGMEHVDAAGYEISGDVCKITIFKADGTQDVPALEGVLLDTPEMPLCILVEGASGARLELSSGEDFWRWNAAERLDGKSRFRITRKDDGTFLYERTLFMRKPAVNELPTPGRIWRTGELLSWSAPEKKQNAEKSNVVSTFDCGKYDWPEQLCRMNRNGNNLPETVCYSSQSTINILKKWVRNHLEELREMENGVLVLRNVRPELCFNASHQDRPKKKMLAHWTLRPLLDFRRWAEKQLVRNGAELVLEPAADSPFAILPSLTGGTHD